MSSLLLLLATATLVYSAPISDDGAAIDARAVRELGIDFYPILIGLRSQAEKDAFDAAFIDYAIGSISFSQFLDKLQKVAPEAHSNIAEVVADLESRVSSLKHQEARHFVQEAREEIFPMVVEAIQQWLAGKITKERRDELLQNSITNLVIMVKYMAKSKDARLELVETFNDIFSLADPSGWRTKYILQH